MTIVNRKSGIRLIERAAIAGHAIAMALTARQIQGVVSRHVEDPDEAGRTCLACGRPWPCDVRQLAVAFGWTPKRAAASAATAATAGAEPVAQPRVKAAPRRSRRAAVEPGVSA
jgi:hypothetical protein